MSVKQSAVKMGFDALTVLQPSGSPAITVSGPSANSLALDYLASYWAIGDLAEVEYLAVEVIPSAVTGSAMFELQVATDSGFTSPVTVATSAVVTEPNSLMLVVERDTITAALPGATGGFLRVYAVLEEDTSIEYAAYPAPIVA